MMFPALDGIRYVPLLSVRPAEIVALRELPRTVHAKMLPHILLRPWLGNGQLDRAFDRLCHSYPSRLFITELDPECDGRDGSALQQEIKGLRDPRNGFENWVSFCRERDQIIPCLQVARDRAVMLLQINSLKDLGRGIAVRLPKGGLAANELILDLLDEVDAEDVVFTLDFGQTDERYLVDVATAVRETRRILERKGSFTVALSSTSFPGSFKEISNQQIFERSFFEAVLSEVNSDGRLFYSDRGSARMPTRGGGGVPAPRIDIPTDSSWFFFRKDLDQDATKQMRAAGYREMAATAIKSRAWDPALNIWGTQMVKLTELGSEFGINSPVRATSTRVNIHLFRQTMFGLGRISSDDLEDDWLD